MALITLNPTLTAFHGRIGDWVLKQVAGKEIVASRPKPRTEWTEQQAAQRLQFKLAAIYGKSVMADPQTKAPYQTKSKQNGVPAFALTVADFLNVPVVDEIDLSGYAGKAGDVIKIRAHDDFQVTGAQVLIRDTEGNTLEQGAATLSSNDGTWQYPATVNLTPDQHVVIAVSATDLPGHKGVKTESR